MNVILAILIRELRLAGERPGEQLHPLAFVILILSLLAFLRPPDATASFMIAGFWIALLLAGVISIDSLFVHEAESGCLSQWLLAASPLSLLVLSKLAAHWLATLIPLLLATPILASLIGLEPKLWPGQALILILASLPITLLAATGAALVLGAERSASLLAVLILPLALPIMIFGTRAVQELGHTPPTSTSLRLLGAFALASLAVCPPIITSALRLSEE